MKKIIIFLLVFVTAVSSLFSLSASAAYDTIAASLNLHAESYLLINMDNNTVVFEKNADKQSPMASLTKIITATVVLENCKDLSAVVTVPEYCITALANTGSSVIGLKPGEEMSVENLLYCLLVHSANDAAMVLADYIGGGDMDTFIKMMNDLAAKHGCTNTSFVNPHGLDDPYQFSTPRDLAVLTQYALTFPVFVEIVNHWEYKLPATNMSGERKLTNTNNLMNKGISDYYCQYASGVKTGSTSTAGKCVISTAQYDGYSYLCVVMNAPMMNIDDDYPLENCAFVDCKKMFEWVIENMTYVQIADSTDIANEVPVLYGRKTDYVVLSPESDMYALVPTGTDAGSLYIEPVEGSLPKALEAPVKKGQTVCKANVKYAGQTIATVNLVASKEVKRSVIGFAAAKIKAMFHNTAFKIIAILVAAIIVCFAVMCIKALVKRKKSRTLHVVTYNDFRK